MKASLAVFTASALLALALLAASPPIAGAGGFASVGLSSVPDGTPPGKPWNVELTILQHGRTPLDNLEPSVIVRPADGGAATRFAAKPVAGKSGVYRASVVFPSAGRWTYAVEDGFTATHSYAPVEISDKAPASVPAPAGDTASGPPWTMALLAALVAGLGATMLSALITRRRRSAAPPGAVPTAG